jgi:hypothetical protein
MLIFTGDSNVIMHRLIQSRTGMDMRNVHHILSTALNTFHDLTDDIINVYGVLYGLCSVKDLYVVVHNHTATF